MYGLVRDPAFNDKEPVADGSGDCQGRIQRSREKTDGGKQNEGNEKPPLPGRNRNSAGDGRGPCG